MLRFYVNFGQVFILRWLWILIKFECHYHTPKRDLYEKFFGSLSLWMIFFLSGHRLRLNLFDGFCRKASILSCNSKHLMTEQWTFWVIRVVLIFVLKCNILLNCNSPTYWCTACCLFLILNKCNQWSINYKLYGKLKNNFEIIINAVLSICN